MTAASSNPSPPDHRLRASSVIVHRIPPESVERFLEWEQGITAAVASSPGYQSSEIYPPLADVQDEWVIVLHFDDSASLQHWLESPLRREWLAKVPAGVGNFSMKTLPAGFGPWFAGMLGGPASGIPAWKMTLTVLLGLYPTVMLLTLFVTPHLHWLPLAMSVLAGNAISVALLQWLIVPRLQALLGRWLRANGDHERGLSYRGLALILLGLGSLVMVFQLLAWLTR